MEYFIATMISGRQPWDDQTRREKNYMSVSVYKQKSRINFNKRFQL